MLNAATLQQHIMIPQEAESDDGHQQIRLSKFPTVLMPRPFTPINGTFSNFVTVNGLLLLDCCV
jgi:hypothetical protein